MTGTAMFSRSLGSAVGVAVFGALVTATTTARFASAPAGLRDRLPGARTPPASPGVRDSAADVVAFVRRALADATPRTCSSPSPRSRC